MDRSINQASAAARPPDPAGTRFRQQPIHSRPVVNQSFPHTGAGRVQEGHGLPSSKAPYAKAAVARDGRSPRAFADGCHMPEDDPVFQYVSRDSLMASDRQQLCAQPRPAGGVIAGASSGS